MMTQLTIKCVIREISTFYSVRARMCMCGSGSSILLAFVHTRARSWREFAKSRFTHFPSILSVHVDSYANDCSRRRVEPIGIINFVHLNVNVVTSMYLFIDDALC